MTAVLGSFLELTIKAVILAAFAAGGIFCGKKYRMHKDASKTENKTLD